MITRAMKSPGQRSAPKSRFAYREEQRARYLVQFALDAALTRIDEELAKVQAAQPSFLAWAGVL